jgi:atypical dual specificity phosphatase
LCNLGSATRDDLLIPQEDVMNYFLNREVLVEEKIDGANMGLSLCENKICAQNRSHYVSAEYHPQFKYLDKWIYQHTEVLWEILESDRYILYGEWCYAKHSIPYASLSDWFTAFDMFDRLENKFWSRSRLEAHLDGTGITLIPLIIKGTFNNIEALKQLVQTKSVYYDGPVEGIVVRVNDNEDQYVERRGKIVRSDFLSGDTHWSKYGCNPNTIVRKEYDDT